MSSTEKTLLKTMREYLREEVLPETNRLVIAYSGGPDSTALLHLSAQLREELGYSLRAAFVDHAMRDVHEREREAGLCTHTAFRLGIHLYRLMLPEGFIESRARGYGGVEAAARAFRYRFFEQILDSSGGAPAILLGHTRDDQTETRIMRFFQGSGIEGLSGMPHRRGHFFRPLLDTAKEDLCRYLEERRIPYSLDSTNETSDYLRNRIRSELVPLARSIFPGLDRSLAELSYKMRLRSKQETAAAGISDEGESSAAGRAHIEKVEADGSFSFFAAEFNSLREWEREELLYRLWNRVHEDEQRRLPHRFVRSIVEFCAGEGRPGSYGRGESLSGHGIELQKKGERIFFIPHVVRREKKGYLKLIEDGRIELPWGQVLNVVRSVREMGSQEKPEVRLEGADESRLIVYTAEEYEPLIIRSRRSGDLFYAGGGAKKLKEIYSEMGIPPQERKHYPVLEDRRGILALVRPDKPGFSVLSRRAAETPEGASLGYRYTISVP